MLHVQDVCRSSHISWLILYILKRYMHVHILNFGIFEMQFKCFKFVNLVWQQNIRSEFYPWSTEEIKLAWNKDKTFLAEPGTDLNLVQYILCFLKENIVTKCIQELSQPTIL